ncbi:MAG: META domain-containing protein [Burkholderiales bacterium]|nr:META domain-containing protein [Burkholderiales bacterium]
MRGIAGCLLGGLVGMALLGSAQAQTLATAQGHEPAWSAQFGDKRFDFQAADGTRFALDVEARPGGSPLQVGLQVRGEPLLLQTERRLCHDLKSGQPFPWQVSVTMSGRVYHGCGGDPALLLQGRSWSGDGLRSLQFEAGGRYSAQLACNRLQGSYRADVNGLSLGQGPMTRRACADEAGNAAEDRTLAQLARVWAFDLDAQGRLRLRLTDGAALVLEATPR